MLKIEPWDHDWEKIINSIAISCKTMDTILVRLMNGCGAKEPVRSSHWTCSQVIASPNGRLLTRNYQPPIRLFVSRCIDHSYGVSSVCFIECPKPAWTWQRTAQRVSSRRRSWLRGRRRWLSCAFDEQSNLEAEWVCPKQDYHPFHVSLLTFNHQNWRRPWDVSSASSCCRKRKLPKRRRPPGDDQFHIGLQLSTRYRYGHRYRYR